MISFLSILLVSAASLAAGNSSIQVQGSCEVKVIPDRGMMTFTAENQSKNLKEAVAKTTDQINRLKEKIQSLKLADLGLKNTHYQVYPIRDYEKDRWVDRGTRSSLSLEVTTSDIPRLGEAIELASKEGIQIVSSLTTFLSLEKTRSEYLKCLDLAAEDARQKGLQLAKKLEFKLGPVIQVIESPLIQSQPRPMYEAKSALLRGSMGDTPQATSIEAGEQQYSSTIQVSFSIK
jgi:uncharacterized protein YggE